MKEPFFLPKGSATRKKNIMILHIEGLVLMVALLATLGAALGNLLRYIIAYFVPVESLFSGFQDASMMDMISMDPMDNPVIKLFTIWGVISTVTAIVMLIVVIVIVILMKKRISMILEDPTIENAIRVKKSSYVWLGFLLGAYGGHLFALKKKKRALIYLGIGLAGTFLIPILFFYTSGISFADAFLACFIEKDAEGYITLEDYPYWL